MRLFLHPGEAATRRSREATWVRRLEAVIARGEIERRSNEATRRLKQDVTEAAFAEQQRLMQRAKCYNDRLASSPAMSKRRINGEERNHRNRNRRPAMRRSSTSTTSRSRS